MIFYCFPRIIGRVHREGKAIHQSTAERNRERRGDREKGREGWREREAWGGGVQDENGRKDRRGQVGGKQERKEGGRLREQGEQDGDRRRRCSDAFAISSGNVWKR